MIAHERNRDKNDIMLNKITKPELNFRNRVLIVLTSKNPFSSSNITFKIFDNKFVIFFSCDIFV